MNTTQGPWGVRERDGSHRIVGADGSHIARVLNYPKCENDAALIAQAPSMIQALVEVCGLLAKPDGEAHVDKCINLIVPILETLRKDGAL